MDSSLREFLKQLVRQAIQALIYTTAWKLPLGIGLILLAALFAAAIYWRLY